MAAKNVTFITKYPGLTLTAKGERWLRNNAGEIYEKIPGKEVQFDGMMFVANEESAEKGGFDSLDELLDYLYSHPNLNVDFYDRTNPPDEPKPTVSQQLTAIAKAAALADANGIEAVLSVERDTHNRDVVFEAAEAALAALAGDEGDGEEKASSTSATSKSASTA